MGLLCLAEILAGKLDGAVLLMALLVALVVVLVVFARCALFFVHLVICGPTCGPTWLPEIMNSKLLFGEPNV